MFLAQRCRRLIVRLRSRRKMADHPEGLLRPDQQCLLHAREVQDIGGSEQQPCVTLQFFRQEDGLSQRVFVEF